MQGYLQRLKDDSRPGWAINYGESSLDEVGVAAPVYDHRGDVVAAVLIPAPRFHVSKERLLVLGESCMAAADKVSARLGGNASQAARTLRERLA